jgi:hypothetical protein
MFSDNREDAVYPATQDAMTAEITYRQHRLACEYQRGVCTNTRRWNRPSTNATNTKKSDACPPH